MKRKEISLKNVIVLLIICVFSLFLVLALILINNSSNVKKDNSNKNSNLEEDTNIESELNDSINNNAEDSILNENYTINTDKYSITIPAGFNVVNTNNANEEIVKKEDYSKYLIDENINKGIVIKDNIGNEFVWIPVNNVEDLYVLAENNYKTGRLYDITIYMVENGTIDEAIKQNLVEYNEKVDKKFNNTLFTIFPYNFDSLTNKATSVNEPSIIYYYEDDEDFRKQLEKEFNDMLQSVKKYKGFYIGRYETGDLSKNKLVVKKNNTDLGNQNWYTMYEKCKNITDNKNVTTSMIWGCQWDAAVLFLLNNSNGDSLVSNCNIINNILYDDNNILKNKGQAKLLPTGNTNSTENNNIYDMSGYVYEWTLETGSLNTRVARGGYYNANDFLTSRNNFTLYLKYPEIGCRSALMIKL